MPDQFRAEVARIMSEDPLLPIMAIHNPASRGWLRRPEFDTPGLPAWELPHGSFVAVVEQSATEPATEQLPIGP